MRFLPRAILPCLVVVTALLLAAHEARSQPATNAAVGEAPAEAARNDARRAQLAAAHADAVQSLRQDTLAAPLAPDLTVRTFLYRTGGTDAFLQQLQSAELRGGTRWRSDDIVEIMLQLPGGEVADTLARIAAERPDRVGVSPEALRRGLDRLRGQTFSAIGTSMGPRHLTELRPDDPDGPWRQVSDAQRKAALTAAWYNAMARVVESLRPIDTGNGKPLGEAMDKDEVIGELRQWLSGRPVTKAEFRENLEVGVSLSAPPEEVWPVLRSSLLRFKFGPSAEDGVAWEDLHRRVVREMSPAVGWGRAVADRPATAPAPGPMPLPRDPPAWVAEQIDVVGSAQGTGMDLRARTAAARAAEADALAKLRAKVNALPLGDNATLGELAARNPNVERTIARTFRRTTPAQIEYGDRGDARIRMSLVLHRLWRELDAARSDP